MLRYITAIHRVFLFLFLFIIIQCFDTGAQFLDRAHFGLDFVFFVV